MSGAVSCFKKALAAVPASVDPSVAIVALQGIVLAYRSLGQEDFVMEVEAEVTALIDPTRKEGPVTEACRERLQLFLDQENLEHQISKLLSEAAEEICLDQVDGGITLLELAMDIAMQAGSVKLEGVVCGRLGEAYEIDGRDMAKALDYQRVALQIFSELGNKDSQSVTLLRIGCLLRGAGELKQALTAFNRSLKLQRELLGSDRVHISKTPRGVVELLAKTLNNIGEVYRTQGKLQPALARLTEALEMKLRILGAEHLDVAATQDNLGLVYREMGNLPTALKYLRASMKAREKALGPYHREVARSKLNLAAVVHQLTDSEGAYKLWEESVQIFKANGDKSLEMAKAYNNMAAVKEEKGDRKTALALHKQAMEIKLAVAPGSLTVADSLYNLAILYEQNGQILEALDAAKRSLDITVACVGSSHPNAKDTKALVQDLKQAAARPLNPKIGLLGLRR
eukprot:CAMPEP_0184288498 /NCGR_PEP_ID=MMETSP1049-20130417/1022_1 /TAXON_ID=77928 /ORGANISM="Proteomonas sulcata, Strain CCMP704" /LENGTH=455 /DNA_ID=CAMNT_0026594925 /DNA_START=61 /DNA_END=1427 /DNA_ORIENTATION=-